MKDSRQTWWLLAPLVISYCTMGCGQRQASEESSNALAIFGSDDRVSPVSLSAPWDRLGSITPTGCTGTLVGAKQVLTAAHCLFDDDGELDSRTFTFRLGYHRGRSIGSARVVRVAVGTRYTREFPERDWALLELDTDLAGLHNVRPLPLVEIPTPSTLTRILFAGYPEGSRDLMIQYPSCTIYPNPNSNFYAHDCDTAPGHSGAPLVMRLPGGGFGVVGVHVLGFNGYIERFTLARANFAIPIALFSETHGAE